MRSINPRFTYLLTYLLTSMYTTADDRLCTLSLLYNDVYAYTQLFSEANANAEVNRIKPNLFS